MIPLRQVVADFNTVFEDEIIERRNRKPTITVYADPGKGLATSLFERVAPQVEAIELPPGYVLEWGASMRTPGMHGRGSPQACRPSFSAWC
jgi:multidrug efflux pump subunit AcrB